MIDHPIANKEYVIKTMVEITAKPLKKWGQNFLIDDKVAEAIVKSIDLDAKKRVLEIGSGLGALSYHLVKSKAHVDLLEIDPLLSEHLRKVFRNDSGVTVITQDVLKTNLSGYDVIVGNLPYYITTPIIEQVLDVASTTSTFVAMVQKEAYPRINAKLGNESYGPLSILISYLGKVKMVSKVSKVCFLPTPHVDSLVFKIDFRKDIDPVFTKELTKVVKGLFRLRRKTILNNLYGYLGDKEKAAELLLKLNTPINKRPEELPLSFYVSLTQLLNA